jgi:hypothetical protein
MMVIAGSSKTFVITYETTRCYNQEDHTPMKTSNLKWIYFKDKLCLLACNVVLLSESQSAFWRNIPLSFKDQRVSQATNQQEAGSKLGSFLK